MEKQESKIGRNVLLKQYSLQMKQSLKYSIGFLHTDCKFTFSWEANSEVHQHSSYVAVSMWMKKNILL